MGVVGHIALSKSDALPALVLVVQLVGRRAVDAETPVRGRSGTFGDEEEIDTEEGL